MTHPQQPTMGWPGPAPYPGQARPSGGTAITAAVLAIVKILIDGSSFVPGLDVTRDFGLSAAIGLGHLVPTVLLLLVGSILVFARVKAGAILLLTGAALNVLALVSIAVLTGGDSLDYVRLLAIVPLAGVLNLLSMVLNILVLILAALPSTFRYLGASRRPVHPGPPIPPGYPPQTGYGPPSQPGYGQHPPRQW
ncbi:hypothetical protein ACFWY9_23960 [Amycolatopsis sp. NPDC059027]|uniref:hypothetical protein n=1 Tax=unclassified Amycolatopsis TaxID=2618356 RepID=UPI00366BB6C2